MAATGQEDPGSESGASFESLARRYWGAWGDAMRNAMPGAGSALPGALPGMLPGMTGGATPGAGMPGAQAWHDAIDWWTQYAYGGRSEVNDALTRFNGQARQWYGQMQQVATQFAGQDARAGDITQAWKRALGAVGENPFPEMFRSMRGQGQQGLDQWIEDASPYLAAWREESASWLKIPAFGVGREHQQRTQRLAEAQLDYQQQNSAYHALMLKASQSAYEIFESKLAEREEPGRQIDAPRALFDLWIDAAEEAYAQIALSKEFREVYGRLVNAQMRLRAGVQREVEQASAQFGMPTRSELDGAHRKIAELERALRRLRDAAAAPMQTVKSASRPAAKPAAKPKPPNRAPARAKQTANTPRKPKAARNAAPAPATRRAPTNGFSSAIPIAPAPMTAGKSKPAVKRKR